MKLHVLFMQRKEAYYGEHAPEALEILTEFQAEENEEVMVDLLKKHQTELEKEDEVLGIAWLTLEVNGVAIRDRLVPAERAIPAKVV